MLSPPLIRNPQLIARDTVEPQEGRKGGNKMAKSSEDGRGTERRARVHFPVEECSLLLSSRGLTVRCQKSNSGGTF